MGFTANLADHRIVDVRTLKGGRHASSHALTTVAQRKSLAFRKDATEAIPMSITSKKDILQILEKHNTLTLATCRGGLPWAASLFFASDDDLNLYFVSDHRTRHAADIAADGRVVATVNPDCGRWDEVRGLQIRGRAVKVTGAKRDAALQAYLEKYSDIQRLFHAPASACEKVIAERLGDAHFYRVTPEWVRIIDNSKGFGHNTEVDL